MMYISDMCKLFCPNSDKIAFISIKKQGGLRYESGLFFDQKWPSCFPKACLLDDNVNIVYHREAHRAPTNSISQENPYKTAMTQ